MAKATSSATRQEVTEKKATATKPRTRTKAQPSPPSSPAVSSDGLDPLLERLSGLEEKVTTGLATVSKELHLLAARSTTPSPDDGAPAETVLPIIADLIKRNLMEHLAPIIATLKRLEERIGFVSNRLKSQQGGQERQKPWRHDQPRHLRPRPSNGQRAGQGQNWTPPSAASVQGHFAPRSFGREGGGTTGEEE
ncbi:MAG: hypothetical protein NZ578_17840 [Candidatus Binatia bacterium]|nr:hypothetical protein [Candidatus Binatia bacterium]